jgi:hypothetical protein
MSIKKALNQPEIAVLFFVLLVGCGAVPDEQPAARVRSTHPPLHFLALVDVSKSVAGLIPRLQPEEELTPLLDYAQEYGGTVGVISFGVQSRPSVRAVFHPPLRAADDAHVNVFLRQPKPDPQQLAQDIEAYRAYCVAERERFLAGVAELLEESADATNLVSGMVRAEAYFSEVDGDVVRVLLVISDFIDTTSTDTFELQLDPGVRVLAVSDGIRDFGILQSQIARFETFESISAAISAAVPRR